MDRKKTTLPIERYHLEPQTDAAFTVQQDQRIRVIDAEGEQVADLICFARRNTDEYLSSGAPLIVMKKFAWVPAIFSSCRPGWT